MLLVMSVLFACNSQAGYVLKGVFKGAGDGKAVLMMGKQVICDTVEMKAGKFVFEGETPHVGFALVVVAPEGKEAVQISLVLENSRIEMRGNWKNVGMNEEGDLIVKGMTVTGSRNHDVERELSEQYRVVEALPEFKKYAELAKKVLDTPEILEDTTFFWMYRKEFDAYMARVKEEQLKIMAVNPSVEAAAYWLCFMMNEMPLEELELVFGQFDAKVRESEFADMVAEGFGPLFAGFGSRTAAALLSQLVLLTADELLLAGVGDQFHGFDRLAFLHLLQVEVDGLDHRGGFGPRGVGQHGYSAFEGGAQRAFAEYCHGRQVVGSEFLDQGLDIRRRIERQQVVIGQFNVVQLSGDRTGQDDGIERKFELGKRFRQLGFVGLAQREQEFLLLVFDDQLDERCERSVGKRNLAFAVDDVFLQVEGYGLRLADVFHGFGHGDARLFADVEEAVDCRAGREDDGRVREYFDPLGAELLEGYALYADKGLVGDLHVVFLG
mgnify:CR=1 FL=1